MVIRYSNNESNIWLFLCQLHAFVEYESVELAERAVSTHTFVD